MRFASWVTVVTCLASSSCVRWNANKHFEYKQRLLDEKSQQEKITALQTTEVNVAQARRTAMIGVRAGIGTNELLKIAGYRFELLARTSSANQIWERRRYMLSHLVASRWGSFSAESKLCDKGVELFTITLVNGIVREIDYGY